MKLSEVSSSDFITDSGEAVAWVLKNCESLAHNQVKCTWDPSEQVMNAPEEKIRVHDGVKKLRVRFGKVIKFYTGDMLTDLAGCPTEVDQILKIGSRNAKHLKTLDGLVTTKVDALTLRAPGLETFGNASIMAHTVQIEDTGNVESWKGISRNLKYCKELWMTSSGCPQRGMLELVMINGIESLFASAIDAGSGQDTPFGCVVKILDDHLTEHGKTKILELRKKLMDAGFGEYV